MQTYKIEIKETLIRVVEVEADSYEEAENYVSNRYKQERIVLDSSDFEGVEFSNANNPTRCLSSICLTDVRNAFKELDSDDVLTEYSEDDILTVFNNIASYENDDDIYYYIEFMLPQLLRDNL